MPNDASKRQHYKPRQVPKDEVTPDAGKWYWTMRTGKHWIAFGYCGQEYDCEGHDTAEEARDHFTEYMVNERLFKNLNDRRTPKPCQICGKETIWKMDLNGEVYQVCQEEQTAANARKLHGLYEDFSADW